MRKIAGIALICVLVLSFNRLVAQPKSHYTPQEYIDKVIKNDPNYKNAVVAIKAVDEKGKTIAHWNSNLPLLTASTLKTVTTGLALIYLGEDYRFTTKVAYSGTIKDGTLHGNVYIIGGGDPTLGSSDPVAPPIDSVFGVWTDALKNLGINKIEGNVVVDDSYLEREVIPDSWSWGNIGYDYGSAPSGLPFNEDVQMVKLVPGKNEGDPVEIIVDFPQIPDFHFINTLSTGAAKTGDQSEYYTSDLARIGKFTGTVALDRDTVKNTISSKFGYLSCGWEFREFLVKSGISVGSTILTPDAFNQKEELTPVTETYSKELWKIVEVTNHISNNFYAETLFKTLGKVATGEGSYSAASKTALKLLDSLGVNTVGYTQDDGSGLSRQNYLSPNFFVDFYTMMSTKPVFQKYIESMPYVGVGTFKNVMKGPNFNPEIAGRVHAKSGSLSNVKTYAGYVYGGEKTGLIKFAILVNNYACPTRQIQKHLEGFMYSLASTE